MIGGAEMLFRLHALESQDSIEKPQLWMMCASFDSNLRTTIFSSYNTCDITDIAFYNEQFFFVRHISKHNVKSK